MDADTVEFVYFDLDDTLLDHRYAEHQALGDLCTDYEDAFAQLSVETLRSAYRDHNTALWKQYEEGEIDAEELKRRRFEQLLEQLAVTDVEAQAVNEHYLKCYANHWTLTDGSRAAFHTVADHFPVGILTNGFADTQHAKLDQFPEVRDRLQALIISDEVEAAKPHPEIFEKATRAAGVPPENILYVGNSYRSDVQGALRASWQIAWYGGDAARVNGQVFCFEDWPELTQRLPQNGQMH